MSRVSFDLMRDRLARSASELKLSIPQAQLLLAVEPDRPLAQHELAARLHCDPSNVTGLAARLEARGLVARCPPARDRRVRQVRLTPEGEVVRRSLLERLECAPEEIMALSSDDQRRWLDLLLQAFGEREGESCPGLEA
jgi:DNA-binding MarR family transcriptional regulator